jgi:hypothetical protein
MFQIVVQKFFEKRYFAVAREIDKLVGYHNIAPANLLAQASTGSSSQNMGTTDFTDSPYIGPVVDLAGRDGVISPVTRQDGYIDGPNLSAEEVGAGLPVWGLDIDTFGILQNIRVF